MATIWGEMGLCEKCNYNGWVWKVPFVLSWPGHIPEGEHRHDLMELIDFGSTLGALTGVDLAPGMRGRDLFNSPEPEGVFGIIDWRGSRRAAVRTKKYRYDCTLEYKNEKVGPEGYDANLIDIENDPLEEKNLIRDPALAQTAREMHERIESWIGATTPKS